MFSLFGYKRVWLRLNTFHFVPVFTYTLKELCHRIKGFHDLKHTMDYWVVTTLCSEKEQIEFGNWVYRNFKQNLLCCNALRSGWSLPTSRGKLLLPSALTKIKSIKKSARSKRHWFLLVSSLDYSLTMEAIPSSEIFVETSGTAYSWFLAWLSILPCRLKQ